MSKKRHKITLVEEHLSINNDLYFGLFLTQTCQMDSEISHMDYCTLWCSYVFYHYTHYSFYSHYILSLYRRIT